MHAFVTSRPDNLDSLLVELPECVLKKLQLLQNNVAELTVREKKSSHVITPQLKQFHWLSIAYHIQCKIVFIVYEYRVCLHEIRPVYLSSLDTNGHPKTSMCLRSDKKALLDSS